MLQQKKVKSVIPSILDPLGKPTQNPYYINNNFKQLYGDLNSAENDYFCNCLPPLTTAPWVNQTYKISDLQLKNSDRNSRITPPLCPGRRKSI